MEGNISWLMFIFSPYSSASDALGSPLFISYEGGPGIYKIQYTLTKNLVRVYYNVMCFFGLMICCIPWLIVQSWFLFVFSLN